MSRHVGSRRCDDPLCCVVTFFVTVFMSRVLFAAASMSWVHEPLRRRDDCQYDAGAVVKRGRDRHVVSRLTLDFPRFSHERTTGSCSVHLWLQESSKRCISAVFGAAIGPRRVTLIAAAALPHRAASCQLRPANLAAIMAPVWTSPAPLAVSYTHLTLPTKA